MKFCPVHGDVILAAGNNHTCLLCAGEIRFNAPIGGMMLRLHYDEKDWPITLWDGFTLIARLDCDESIMSREQWQRVAEIICDSVIQANIEAAQLDAYSSPLGRKIDLMLIESFRVLTLFRQFAGEIAETLDERSRVLVNQIHEHITQTHHI